MQEYIGLKTILAEPTQEPQGGREGYKVTYENGYETWSPKDVFEEAYRPIKGAPFSIALEGLRRGEAWKRTGWNGPDQYLLAQFPDKYSKMTLPYVYIKTQQDDLIPWLVSQGDLFAEDWVRLTVPG